MRLLLHSLLLLCFLCLPSIAQATAEKPNIIYILSDDVGYGDIGCYGATKVKTPHLDRLAAALDEWKKELVPPAFPGSSVKNEDWGPGGANQKARANAARNEGTAK